MNFTQSLFRHKIALDPKLNNVTEMNGKFKNKQRMKDIEILELYGTIVSFLGQVLGPDCEVVLHDLKRLDSSIIAIEHGNLSNRHVGGPATDLLLKVIQDQSYKKTDFVANYLGSGPDNKAFRSSSLFIKNPKNKIIGALCVNFSLEPLFTLSHYLDRNLNSIRDINYENLQNATVHPLSNEVFLNDANDVMQNVLIKVISRSKISPDRMTRDEKVKFVSDLFDEGFFMFKGSVAVVAEAMNVSEPTAYRYLKKVKKENNNNKESSSI